MTQNAPPSALQQHPRYAAAIERFGRAPRMLELEGAQVLALTRRIGPVGLALINRPPPGGAAGWRALHAQLGGPFRRALIVTPDGPEDEAALAAAGFARIRTPAHIAELELNAAPDARRAAMQQKWRNRLHAAERAEAAGALKIRRRALPPDPHHPALIEEALQRRARRYAGLPPAFAAAFASAAPGAALLFEALHKGAPCARMLFLLHPPGASYFLGWTGPEGRRLSAHQLLLDRAAARLQALGVETLDLGLIDTEDAPGLARFKIGAGARIRPLGGTWLRGPGSALCARLDGWRAEAAAAPPAQNRRSTLAAS